MAGAFSGLDSEVTMRMAFEDSGVTEALGVG